MLAARLQRWNQHFLYGSLTFRGGQVSREGGGKLEVTVRAPTCLRQVHHVGPRQGEAHTYTHLEAGNMRRLVALLLVALLAFTLVGCGGGPGGNGTQLARARATRS